MNNKFVCIKLSFFFCEHTIESKNKKKIYIYGNRIKFVYLLQISKKKSSFASIILNGKEKYRIKKNENEKTT